MSKQSEEARAAAKKKVERITRVDPKGKIDASGYTPPDELMPDVKTGMRPISQRQFKKGGKIHGEHAKHHAGRKARASGGALDEDYKKDNAKRVGEKHEGGFKHGGKTKHRDAGGQMQMAYPSVPSSGIYGSSTTAPTKAGMLASASGLKRGGKAPGNSDITGTRPTGGRLAKAEGGKVGKDKVNINIIVASKKDEPPHPPMLPPGMLPPGGPPGAPGAAAKPPMPSPGGAPPMAGPAPGGAPPGMPPMGPH